MKRIVALVLFALLLAQPSFAVITNRPQLLFKSQANCPQAGAFLQRLGSSQPSAAMRLRYQKLICTLVNQKIWYKLDALYILAAETQTAALANLVSKNYTLTVNGTMTFGPNAGFMGDGSTGYLTTGFVPSTAGGEYTAASASMGIGITNPRQVFTIPGGNTQIVEMGTTTTSGSDFDQVSPVCECTNFGFPANGSSGNIGTGNGVNSTTLTTANGAWIVSLLSGNLNFYQNGTAVAAQQTGTTHSLPQNQIVILAFNVSGTVQSFSPDTASWAFIGGGLTQSDVTVLTNLLSIFPSFAGGVPAAKWGFIGNKFSYNFALTGLDGIDYTGTKAPGFQLYNSYWFGCAAPAACSGSDSAPSGAFSFSGGLVTVGNTTSGPRLATRGDTSSAFVGTVATNVLTVSSVLYGPLAPGQVLGGAPSIVGLSITSCNTQTPPFTCQLSGSATLATPTNLKGNSSIGVPTFPAGGYFEAIFTNNPANDTGSNGFPSFWLEDIAGLYSQDLTAGYGELAHFLELDIWEGKSGARAADMNTFDWNNLDGGSGSGNLGTNNAVRQSYAAITNATALHSYGMLWVPSTKNSGTGIIQFFLDRIPITNTITYSSGAGASPVCSPSNPNGCLLIGESGNFVLMFDSGGGGGNAYPINLQSVNVWQ